MIRHTYAIHCIGLLQATHQVIYMEVMLQVLIIRLLACVYTYVFNVCVHPVDLV